MLLPNVKHREFLQEDVTPWPMGVELTFTRSEVIRAYRHLSMGSLYRFLRIARLKDGIFAAYPLFYATLM